MFDGRAERDVVLLVGEAQLVPIGAECQHVDRCDWFFKFSEMPDGTRRMVGAELLQRLLATQGPFDSSRVKEQDAALPVTLIEPLEYLLIGPAVVGQIALDIQRRLACQDADHNDRDA